MSTNLIEQLRVGTLSDHLKTVARLQNRMLNVKCFGFFRAFGEPVTIEETYVGCIPSVIRLTNPPAPQKHPSAAASDYHHKESKYSSENADSTPAPP
jgi:hypothetical protein